MKTVAEEIIEYALGSIGSSKAKEFLEKEENQLIDFLAWFNEYEELGYTKKGIEFYVEKYLTR